MTANTLDDARRRQNIMDDRGIKFRPDIDTDKWPLIHKKTFGHVRTLGSTLFNSWVEDVSADWRNSPWKLDTQRRAREVVEIARDCRDQDVNESVWRRKLESFIFQRLDKDVSCRHCAARLWRSYIEAVPNSREEFAPHLLMAQNDRTVCQCPLEGPNGQEAGLSIFDFREGTRIYLDANAQSKLNRKYEIPDKVYALRPTGTLRQLLRQKDRREEFAGQTLQEALSPSLFSDVHPIVFPFLVGESKSSKSSGSSQYIDRQVALVLEKSLLIQDRLRKATGSRSTWVAGPMVWCLTHKGPWWRLSAGYMRDDQANINIVSKLWEAEITDTNGAIQLLLIVDYICDWARSVHREAIIRELQKLAPPLSDNVSDLSSLARLSGQTYRRYRVRDGSSQTQRGSQHLQNPSTVSNIQSSSPQAQERLDRIASWWVGQESQRLDAAIKRDPFCQYDSSHGVIRDANYVRSRVLGLYITDSTFVYLAQCRQTDKQSIELLRRIRRRFEKEEPVLVEQSTLDDLEANWYGNVRRLQVHDNPQEIFQVIFTVSAYIDSDWSLTRELCYVAISKSAKKLLNDGLLACPNGGRKGYLKDDVWMKLKVQPSRKVADALAPFLKSSAIATLAGCLYRSSVRLIFTKTETYDSHVVGSDGEIICAKVLADKPRSRDVAWLLYRLHRIGRNEPFVPFLRTSQTVDDLRSLKGGLMRSNPWTTYNLSPSNAIPAYSTNKYGNILPGAAVCCIYILDRENITSLLEDVGSRRETLQYSIVTERLSPTFGRSINWNVTLEKTMGEGLRRAKTLLDHFTDTIFQDEEEESCEASSEGNNMEDLTDNDNSSEDCDNSDTGLELSDDPISDDAE